VNVGAAELRDVDEHEHQGIAAGLEVELRDVAAAELRDVDAAERQGDGGRGRRLLVTDPAGSSTRRLKGSW
jgi:hypothetical protein